MPHGTGVSAQQRTVETAQDTALNWPKVLGEVTEGREVVEVALLWGDRPLEVHHFRSGQMPTLGHLPKDSIHLISRAVGGGFVLIREEQQGRVLRIPADAGLALHGAAGTVPRQELEAQGRLRASTGDDDAQELDLQQHERAVIAIGQLRLAIRQVAAPPRIAGVILNELDFSFFKLAAITAMAAIAFLVALMAPSAEEPLYSDIIVAKKAAPPVKTVILPEPPKPEALKLKAVAQSPQAPADRRAPRTPRRDQGAALLGVLKNLREAGASVFDDDGLGKEIENATAKLHGGSPVATVEGIGGPRGPGSDGPGTGGMGPIGSVGTLPGGPGGGGTSPFGLPGASLGRAKVTPRPERTTVVGGLDKDQIARVIRRHQSEIRYCYESALNQAPDLAGKVAVVFTIDPTGNIAEAQVSESTLDSATAESCIVSRIRRWKFPEPRGGGIVSVNFPWLFKPAGQ